MESPKSQHGVIVSFCVAAISLAIAVSALTLTAYQHRTISAQDERIAELERMVVVIKAKMEISDDLEVLINKREEVAAQQPSNANQVSLNNIEILRGPPGRDGRDGADGKNGTNGRDGRDAQDIDVDKLVNQIFQQASMKSLGSGTDSKAASQILGGSTYVRWGRTTCANSSQTVYSGFVASSHHTHFGGGSNYQCLPEKPEFSTYVTGDIGSWVYGAEYETGSHIFTTPTDNENVPCARCYVPARSASMMIPAKTSCPAGWTKEYGGYLMAGHHTHRKAYAFECIDKEPEAVPQMQGNENGALLYFQQIDCHSTGHCPPYVNGAELTCVVCTK